MRDPTTAEVLRDHPWCIFCGGVTKAVELDHIPARVSFARRAWPHGYVFPSCRSCNARSSQDEQIIALFSRLYPDASTEAEANEVNSMFKAMANNHPDLLSQLQPTARQVRSFLKKSGIELPPGTFLHEFPILSAAAPRLNDAMATVTRKLILALHWKHTGIIIPPQGGITWRWYSNVDKYLGNLPDLLFEVIRPAEVPMRGQFDLSDQFHYAYATAPDGAFSLFFVAFRQAFAIAAAASTDASSLKVHPAFELLRPYPPN